jgi:hypothetical protein
MQLGPWPLLEACLHQWETKMAGRVLVVEVIAANRVSVTSWAGWAQFRKYSLRVPERCRVPD